MSTDWIKMRVDLRTHPKVVRMASALKADKLRVIGGLFAVWSIFDAHAIDGVLEGYTFREIDEQLGWKGFAAAMAGIDWLADRDGDGLDAPRFDEHNGQSAKRRAMETERKRLEREAEKAAAEADKAGTRDGQLSASDADAERTREEKRREEEQEKEPTVLVGTAYRPPPSPNAEIVELYRTHLPQLPGVEVLNDTRKRAIACRWREVCSDGKLNREAGLEWFAWYFAHVAKSKFLTGQIPGKSGRVWQADFDFLMNASKFPRVVEGSYHKDTV